MLPRTAAAAFGVRISMDSPGRMRCFATASTTLPSGSVTTARLLADRDLGQLAHRENGLAPQQHADEGIRRRADLVAPEDVVLELQREGRRDRRPGDGGPSVQRGDDAD